MMGQGLVLATVRDNPGITALKIAEISGSSQSSVNRCLRQLVKYGDVEFVLRRAYHGQLIKEYYVIKEDEVK